MAWYRSSKWGVKLAGVWFVAYGVTQLVPKLSFDGLPLVLAILAIAAGVLILLDR